MICCFQMSLFASQSPNSSFIWWGPICSEFLEFSVTKTAALTSDIHFFPAFSQKGRSNSQCQLPRAEGLPHSG